MFSIETMLSCCILLLLYKRLSIRFNFPDSLPDNTRQILWRGYLFFFAATLPVAVVLHLLADSFRQLVLELTKLRHLFRRSLIVATLYVAIDVVFAALYRLCSLEMSGMFNVSLNSFLDAFYFSTVTMTTLGYGEIRPEHPLGKILVSIQTLCGLFLLAAILASAISASTTSRTEGDSGEM